MIFLYFWANFPHYLCKYLSQTIGTICSLVTYCLADRVEAEQSIITCMRFPKLLSTGSCQSVTWDWTHHCQELEDEELSTYDETNTRISDRQLSLPWKIMTLQLASALNWTDRLFDNTVLGLCCKHELFFLTDWWLTVTSLPSLSMLPVNSKMTSAHNTVMHVNTVTVLKCFLFNLSQNLAFSKKKPAVKFHTFPTK